jgi:hypothetical protein
VNIELLIENGGVLYQPVVPEGITWETARKGSPGKLTFDVVKDGIINFVEGNPVRFKFGTDNIFYGFVFKKGRDKDQMLSVTAYDQLRYFKNKDTCVYENMTATQVIKKKAADYKLQCGTLADTGWVIEARSEDNTTLFDIANNALDITTQNTGKLFVLYDDFGKLALSNIEDMKLDLLIDSETAENFNYESSIDGETYNQIKLAYDNKETGKREIYIAKDSEHINEWGVLQYYDKIDNPSIGAAKANALLGLYNQKTRSLSINNAWGDIRVRGGSLVPVCLNLGDMIVKNYMIVEKVKHTFKEDHHTMDLTLRGGLIAGE